MKKIYPLFELSNVRKTYPSREKSALDIKKIVIPRNGLVAVIGYSGSGKTTLLNILGLLDKPDSNQHEDVKILYYPDDNSKPEKMNGDISDVNKFRRTNFGFIFQEGYLMSNLTGQANVEIPLHVNGYEVRKERIKDFFHKVGINDNQEHRLPSYISGGEAQRMAVIRSIAHCPKVILADEPSSNLDHDIGMQVMHFLKNWCNENEERSVIWVTHNIHQAIELADYILVLKNGEAFGPYLNRKNEDDILRMLRQGEEIQYNNAIISDRKPDKAENPLFRLFSFSISFAVSDIFPKTGKISQGILPRFIGRKNAQILNMLSLFMVILLTLLFLGISFAFKNYFVLSVSDPRINRITVNGRVIGDTTLTEEHRQALSSLVWAESVSVTEVVWPEKLRKENLKPIREATMGAYGMRTRTIDCYMNPEGEGLTMSGKFGLSTIAINAEDPILTKMPLLTSPDKKMDNLILTDKMVNTLFLDKEGKTEHEKEGIVITHTALKKFLAFSEVPENLKIDHLRAETKFLPIMGVVDWLPFSAHIMVTDAWYLQQFWRGGVSDPKPGFELLNIYVEDKIKDGIPVCDAIESMGFVIAGNTKNTLKWINNITDVIFKFSNLALMGVWILAGTSLFVSYAQAIKKKQKEIGVLMAKGITRRMLYVVFWIEILFIWGISVVGTVPVYFGLFGFIKEFVQREFALKQTLNIEAIFNMPDMLWPGVLLSTLALAFITVFFGVRQVLKYDIATILRTGN